MCILIRAALSFLEGFAFAHINLGSCQSFPDQLTNVLTSGGKLSQNIKYTNLRRLQQPPVRPAVASVKTCGISNRAGSRL